MILNVGLRILDFRWNLFNVIIDVVYFKRLMHFTLCKNSQFSTTVWQLDHSLLGLTQFYFFPNNLKVFIRIQMHKSQDCFLWDFSIQIRIWLNGVFSIQVMTVDLITVVLDRLNDVYQLENITWILGEVLGVSYNICR